MPFSLFYWYSCVFCIQFLGKANEETVPLRTVSAPPSLERKPQHSALPPSSAGILTNPDALRPAKLLNG